MRVLGFFACIFSFIFALYNRNLVAALVALLGMGLCLPERAKPFL